MAFRILSDFDGVWTDPAPEAREVEAGLVRRVAALVGRDAREVAGEVALARDLALREPALHGWTPGGRLTAYADEDAFLEISGVASFLTHADHELADRYRTLLRAVGGVDLMVLADEAFREVGGTPGVGEILPEGADVLRELEELGVEMVVVSNSAPEKLVRLFGAIDVHAGENGDARVRIRGGARKWDLGEGEDAIDVRGRSVRVDRPHYRRIVEEVAPDLIVGDVFSLDLALPFHMRASGVGTAPRFLVHRVPRGAKGWVAEHTSSGHVDAVAPRLADLPRIVRGFMASRV
ncbi:MAG: hypothetical protein R3F34_15135 [Planctomycetota bacterium]